MSWVKKVWSRMFADEVEEDAEQEYTVPVEQKSAHVPFRFPLITDEEREIFLKKEQSGQKVTMAEVREELIRRPSQLAQQPVRREVRPEPKPKPIHRQSPRQPIQRQSPNTKPVKETPKPEPIKRRFEPTKVPSPIHGFNEPKPAPIEILLEQKERKEEFHKAISPLQEYPISETIDQDATQISSEQTELERQLPVTENSSEPDSAKMEESSLQTVQQEEVTNDPGLEHPVEQNEPETIEVQELNPLEEMTSTELKVEDEETLHKENHVIRSRFQRTRNKSL